LKSFEFLPYKNILINKESIGNVPMHEVGKLYNNNVVCNEFPFGKTFLESAKLKRGDKNLEFIPKTIPTAVPKYYADSEYSKKLFIKGSKATELAQFCTEAENAPTEIFEYTYKYFHTIEKPRFFGPKNLNINEDWKVHYISPLCMVCEIDINCTGFMLMDTFHTVYRYIFESELLFDDSKKKFGYDTRLTVEMEIMIIKESYMSGTIATQGLEDHTTTLKERIFPELKSTLLKQSTKFYDGLFPKEKGSEGTKRGAPVDLPEIKKTNLVDDLKTLLNPIFGVFIVLLLILAWFTNTNTFIYFVVLINIVGGALIFRKIDNFGERIERVEKILIS